MQGKDAGKPGTDASLDPTMGMKVSVSGLVLDVVGNRIEGAEVQLGQRMVRSGANGDFSFGVIPVSEQETLVVYRKGFSNGRVLFKPLEGVDNFFKLTLQAAEMVMLTDPSQGGELKTESGAVVSVPPNAVVDSAGNPVTGPVEVSMAVINDRDEMAAAPPMAAIDPMAASDAPAAELESFGMVAVDLTANGEPVQLASGSSVTISFPMGAGTQFAEGESVGLWHFDETDQIWKSEGDGVVGPNNVFSAAVSHFSWWNADQVLTKTCVRSRVLDSNGKPIPGASISAEGRSYLGNTHTTTDMSGNFCVEARVSSVIELSALARVGTKDQALAVKVNTARTMATCGRPADCYELPNPLVAIADMPLCQPSSCPQDPNKQACCKTDLGPCDFVVNGDCGGSEDGAWDVPSETPGVMEIPGVPMMMLPPDAGVDSGPPPVQDAGTDAGTDAGNDSGAVVADASTDGGTCGPFFQSQCKSCVETNCTSIARQCMGMDWADGTFSAPCQEFGQCLCDSQTGDPSGCDGEDQPLECRNCLVNLELCVKQNCGVCDEGDGPGGDGGIPWDGSFPPWDGSFPPWDGGTSWDGSFPPWDGGFPPWDGGFPPWDGGAPTDGGSGGAEVNRCDGLIPLATLDPVQATTVGSTLANDWYDNGECSYAVPNRGYLPGFERSYSVSVPAGTLLRVQVTGPGMVVMISDSCQDINGDCVSGGVSASYRNDGGTPRTVYITVDNAAIDVQAPFTLAFSTAEPGCADGILDMEEGCDDGNSTGGDGCSSACYIEQHWACPGDAPCHPIVCGDGIREQGNRSTGYEACDDGNDDSGDGCSASCNVEDKYLCELPGQPCRMVVCGDGQYDRYYEQCEDGNDDAGDGCDSDCQIEPNWTCDKNGTNCEHSICGDGKIGYGEDCDDGDAEGGDGCSALCQPEPGWICQQVGQPCRQVVCGDDTVDFEFEECDDGNTASGDTCTPQCRIASGYACDFSGQNCQTRPEGDLCNNALALPGGLHTAAYSLEGMTADQLNCNYCAITRWFSVIQQPGEVTAVRVNADFAGYVSFAWEGCPMHGGMGEGGPGFSPDSPSIGGIFNNTEAPRTVYFAVAPYYGGTGEFELTIKTGEPGCGDGLNGNYLYGDGSIGDGNLPDESCDDMNTESGDGCNSMCEIEPGYRCDYQTGGLCVHVACGDGYIDGFQGYDENFDPSIGENCDDGNTTPGDGCSATCRIEDGAACSNSSPSECVMTAAGDVCSNARALQIGTNEYAIDDFLPEEGECQYMEGCAPDLWFTYTLQPREVLSLEVSGDFSGYASLQAGRPDTCLSLHYVPGNGAQNDSFSTNYPANLSARNDTNQPLSVMLRVQSYNDSTGTFSINATAGIPTQDCGFDPCQPVVCGDGEINGNEQCDDGDTGGDDGCSGTCVREVGYACTQQPSVCEAISAGYGCEVPSPLAGGVYDFEGANVDQSCEVACWSPVRWFEATVPAGQTLSVWANSANMLGSIRLFDLNRGHCGDLAGARLMTVQFSDSVAGYAGWVNRTGQSVPVLVGVADKSGGEDSSFSLSYRIAATGCGDSLTDAAGHFGTPEQCDDGNANMGDGCSPSCTTEPGWDCQAGACNEIVCGDGIRSSTEGCDDGNTEAGDGCTADCLVENGYVCGGSPSDCRLLQPGDSCENAQQLTDDAYSLTSYVPDLSCMNLCSGADRWFDIIVPGGNTLSVVASTDMEQAGIVGFQGTGCGPWQLRQFRSMGMSAEQGPVSLFWTNESAAPQHVWIAVADTADPSEGNFVLEHHIRPTGCGDFRIDPYNPDGQEACDDGNTQSGDGCSNTCQIENDHVCYGEPSTCVIPLPGDVCETAETLEDGNYSLEGYLWPPNCEHCGIDRWFETTVPAHYMIEIALQSSYENGMAAFYLRNGEDCDSLLHEYTWQEGVGGSLRWFNTGEQAADVMLALLDSRYMSDAEFSIAHRIVPAGCGDQVVDWGGWYGDSEQCDDGNTTSGDGCSETCTPEAGYHCQDEPSVCATTCGDYQTGGTETCDDGNLESDDGCSATCVLEDGYDCSQQYCIPLCGDGKLVGSETCDDGNTESGDGCFESCSEEGGWTCAGEPSVCTPNCGDGVQRGDEVCDDGNTDPGDGCSATCTAEAGYDCAVYYACTPICGDGLILGNEACDDGNTDPGDGCDGYCGIEYGWGCSGTPSTCAAVCGDSIFVDGAEACEDGGTAAGDGCSPTCTAEEGWTCGGNVCNPICADGIVTSAELCDDGNEIDNDGCSSCSPDTGWSCMGEPSICTAVCGDGTYVAAQEGCDDGDTEAGDGCSATCGVETGWQCTDGFNCSAICGDGLILGNETCDDGDADALDGCSDGCQTESGWECTGAPSTCATVCGDGVIAGAEECDDSNTGSSDGCSSTCQLEM